MLQPTDNAVPVLCDEAYKPCMHELDAVGWDTGFALAGIATVQIRPAIAQVSCLPKHASCLSDAQCCIGPCHNGRCQH